MRDRRSMMVALLALLHVLVLVYWLGGDLGAFYGAGFLVDPRRSVAERVMALTLLGAIDMAPRSALILALPTGLSLAVARGWVVLPLALPGVVLGVIWAFHLGWLALAWAVHLRHQNGGGVRRADLAIRWVMAGVVGAVGVAGLAGSVALPLFMALKLLILASAILLGLLVRRQLVPLFPAVRQMVADGPTPVSDAAIAAVIAQTRPVVLTLWLLLLAASWLGLATPVGA